MIRSTDPRHAPAQGRDLFGRLAVLHRPGCAALAEPAPQPAEPMPDEAEIARLFASEAAGRYGIEARAIYDDLRRLVGQLAGLLILARLTSRRETGDLPEIAACRSRQDAVDAALARLAPPGPLSAHRAALAESAALCRAILAGLLDWRPAAPGADAAFAALNAEIRRAHARLEQCSSDRAGLRMIDFSHACCTCGGH